MIIWIGYVFFWIDLINLKVMKWCVYFYGFISLKCLGDSKVGLCKIMDILEVSMCGVIIY